MLVYYISHTVELQKSDKKKTLTEVNECLDILAPRVLHKRRSTIEINFLAVVDVEDDVVFDGVVDKVTDHLWSDSFKARPVSK